MQVRSTFCLLFLLVSSALFAQHASPVMQWQKFFGGSKRESAYSAIRTRDNGYLVVGASFSNDGQVTDHHGSTDSSDAWVVKLDENGELLWAQSYGGTGTDFFIHAVEAGNGDILCVGTTWSNDGDVSGLHGAAFKEDAWVVRINSTGGILWSKAYGGSLPEHANVIRKASDGGYIIAGDAYSTDFDVTGNHGWSDIWVFKIDEAGELQWQRSYGNRNKQFASTMIVTNDGNYVIGGNQTFAENTSPLVCHHVISSNELAYLKIDRNGVVIWEYYPHFPCDSPIHGSEYFLAMLEMPSGELLRMSTYDGEYDKNFWWLGRLQTETGVLIGGHSFPGEPSDRSVFASNLPESTILLADSSILTCLVNQSKFNRGTSYLLSRISITPNEEGYSDFLYQDSFGQKGGTFRGLVDLGEWQYLAVGAYTEGDRNIPDSNHNFDFWVAKFSERNKIQGRVFSDANNNGSRDASEAYLSNIKVESASDDTTYTTTTDTSGYYVNFVGTGSYTTTVLLTKPYYTIAPASKTSVFTSFNESDSADFALFQVPGKNDLKLSITPLSFVRPGFKTIYKLSYFNAGTQTAKDPRLTLVKPASMDFSSASSNPALQGDTLTWQLPDLAPAADGSIDVVLQAAVPPLLNIGDTIQLTASINTMAADETPSDNSDTLVRAVTGSFDPNDKAENGNGGITPLQVASGEMLTYTVRFQNTGNDTAFKVIVRDTLDATLDWSSIEMIAASHPHHLQIKDGKYIAWTFDNILLADSNRNEPASHGSISYGIRPKKTLPLGDTISNSASIYFDFNLPVVTNKHLTIVRIAPPPQPFFQA